MSCKYLELLTDTEAEQIGETETGEAVARPVEVAVGEFCHKKKEYNPDCSKCKEKARPEWI
ncbi:hypothetical protein KHQ81_12935 [Mycoplasmatota bacterium]|nr:hypothetical protein KHQ81_12935 [Mycoplasmatota bacterium]